MFIASTSQLNLNAQFNYTLDTKILNIAYKSQEINLSISEKTFVSFYEVKYHIKEKLGSYKPKKKIIRASKNLTIDTLYSKSKNELIIIISFDFKKQKEKASFLLKQNGNTFLLKPIFISNKNINSLSFRIPDDAKAIFGGGIQFSYCNLKGQVFPLIVEENGVGRGDKGSTFWANLFGASGNEHTTYAPLPFFHTSNKVSYSLNAVKNHFWDIDFSEENLLQFNLNCLDASFLDNFPSLEIQLNEQPKELVARKNVNNPKLKNWMYGYILGIQGGKIKVDSILQKLQTNNIKPSAIWIQDWVGKRKTAIGSRLQWDWRLNETQYPNTKNWIDSLHQNDIKVLGYINPYFVEGGLQAQQGIEKKYFVLDKKNEAYKFKAGGFNAYMIDLSNENARIWMKSIIKEQLISNGFDGWMCDFGEWLPFYPNIKGERELFHNNFSSEWLKLNNEAAEELGKANDLFIFNRSAYSETLNIRNIMWLGDQMGNFGKNDGLASAVNAYNSASLSGFPIIHSDIGGYTAIKLGAIKFLRNKETLYRWIEMEAFTPLFRSHEGLIPEYMEQIYSDVDNIAFFKKFNNIHQDLIPYFKSLQEQYLKTGIPIVKHPYLLYPKDENTYNLQYQFFVGENLLVCPVIEEESEEVEIYFPEGKWKHFFTEEIFDGNQFKTVNAPLGEPAVFWRLTE